MTRFRILPPEVLQARCIACRAMAPRSELSQYGARCASCFAAYCDAPAEPRGRAPHSNDRPAAEWSHMPLATRQYLCGSALGMAAGLQVYERAWRDIEPRDRLRIIAAGQRLVAGLAS